MLGGMWGARLDNPSPKQSKQSRQSPKPGKQPKESRTRSLLAGLVANMLRSPVSWASVYLADQVLFNLKSILFFPNRRQHQVQLQRIFWPVVQEIALVTQMPLER